MEDPRPDSAKTAMERRVHPRLERTLPLQYLEIGGVAHTYDAVLRDLSLGGAGFFAERPLPEGTRLLIGLELEESEEPLVVRAVVRRCVAEREGFVVGVRFRWLGYDQRRSLTVLRRHLEASGLDAGPTPEP